MATVVTLMIVPVPASYELVLCLFPLFCRLEKLQSRRQPAACVLRGALWMTPIVSWSTNTLLPRAFKAVRWTTYNAWTADKIIVPLLTFVVLIYLVHHSEGHPSQGSLL
jgi:hypothetical protein